MSDAQIEISIGIAALCIGQTAFNQERSTFDTVTHDIPFPFWIFVRGIFIYCSKNVVNTSESMFRANVRQLLNCWIISVLLRYCRSTSLIPISLRSEAHPS